MFDPFSQLSRQSASLKNGLINGAVLLLLLFAGACTDSITEVPITTNVKEVNADDGGEKIIIVDGTGKEWDVTHAVKQYGFKADQFDYGLGPNAIRPILDPQMLSEGDPGYPGDDSNLLVIGTRINDEARAYPLTIMRIHEIADERFGDTHVAVGY